MRQHIFLKRKEGSIAKKIHRRKLDKKICQQSESQTRSGMEQIR